jgi:hypothetical protein
MALLGETLVSKGMITEIQLNKALEEQKKSGKKIGEVLVSLGFVTDAQIDTALKG